MLPSKEEFIREIIFRTSRSGGKGGQHVNKVSTRVELIFNPGQSALFSEGERARLLDKLAGKLDSEGHLHVVSQESRSQAVNKERAIEKTLELLEKALHVKKQRKATKVPKAVIEKRLMNKQVNAEKKENRKRLRPADD